MYPELGPTFLFLCSVRRQPRQSECSPVYHSRRHVWILETEGQFLRGDCGQADNLAMMMVVAVSTTTGKCSADGARTPDISFTEDW